MELAGLEPATSWVRSTLRHTARNGMVEPFKLLPPLAPQYVEIVAELLLTATGKVEKFRLRERGVTSGAWDRERAGYELRR
jgi:acyl-CoA synthetase (AMP-forming)/AMP-acid ligase II